jgi:hypothetical protein
VSVRSKLNQLSKALEYYKEGEPLPISIADIYFIMGACDRLLISVDKLEESYKTDVAAVNEEVNRFRGKWKASRKVSTRLNNEVMALRQVMKQASKLSFWRKTSSLKAALKSYEGGKKKFGSADEKIE